MYYDLDLKAKAGSSERKHTALPWPAASMHAGKVQAGERTVDVGKHESIENGKREEKPSISEHNDEKLFARMTKKKKIKRETGRENIQHVAVSKHIISKEKQSV